MSLNTFISQAWSMYADGFRQMTVGKRLWALILIYLLFILLELKLFFFPDILERDYADDTSRAQAVRTTLIDR